MVPPIDKGFVKKSVQDPNILSTIRPVPHGEGLPIPKTPESFEVETSEEELQKTSNDEASTSQDPDFLPSTSTEPHLITPMELNDLIKDLDLPKNKA